MTTYHSIPDLDQRMIKAGATNVALANKSGCCLSTIAMLRAGKSKARMATINTILETLATKDFAYVRKEKALQKRIVS